MGSRDAKGLRIAVDTGGTFTDVVVTDTRGHITIAKALTTPERIFRGMRHALEAAAKTLSFSLETLLDQSEVLIYGTTRATNAIVTGQSARTAFLTTQGFPDTLVLREGGKFNPHDFSRPYPKPYIPRRYSFEIDERVNAEGEVVAPLVESQARTVIAQVGEKGFEAIAVCLLWSIANPAHEQRLGELIEADLPGIPFTLSHRLNPILREYRRASSTAIDASIKPLMQQHLRELETDLRDGGYRGEILVSTTIGGCLDIAGVVERPIHTVRSGPAMAPVAASHYASVETDSPSVLVVDTGGTTFDVGLVRDGTIATTQETWLGDKFTGHMLGLPAVDVRSVGSGGGSIAWLDPGGLLRVGPQSAGARPGPACYGQGGMEPTVTDAALVLGYLDPKYFLGGEMRLDSDAARRALKRISSPLELSIEAAAYSVLAVANETMINAIEDITVSDGVDPREVVLVAGGGAAGIGILAIARELGCPTVVVPRTASVLSACGMQFADIQIEQTASTPVRSRSFDIKAVNEALDAIEKQLDIVATPLVIRGFSDRVVEYRTSAHYAAQVWELDVPLAERRFQTAEDVAALVEAFHDAHERVFTVTDLDSEVEFLNWTGRLTLRLPRNVGRAEPFTSSVVRSENHAERRQAWFGLERSMDTQIVRGSALSPGANIVGPAIIEEETTTLVIPPGLVARLSANGNYLIELPNESREIS